VAAAFGSEADVRHDERMVNSREQLGLLKMTNIANAALAGPRLAQTCRTISTSFFESFEHSIRLRTYLHMEQAPE
jgi:hypothetical protein